MLPTRQTGPSFMSLNLRPHLLKSAQVLLKLFINGNKNIASLLPPLALEPNYSLTCQHYTIHDSKGLDKCNDTMLLNYLLH